MSSLRTTTCDALIIPSDKTVGSLSCFPGGSEYKI